MKKPIILALLLFISICLVSCVRAEQAESDSIQPTPTETQEQLAIESEQPSASDKIDEVEPGVFSRDRILEGIGEWAEKESGLTQKGGYFFDENDEFRKNISGYTAIELSDGSVFGYLDFSEKQSIRHTQEEGDVAYGPIVDYVNDFVSKEAQKAGMDGYVNCSSESAFFIMAKDTEDLLAYYMNCSMGYFWEESQ